MSEPASRAKTEPKFTSKRVKDADGHTLIDGARWHYPKQGTPTQCAIPGCARVLTDWRDFDALAALEVDETELPETEPRP